MRVWRIILAAFLTTYARMAGGYDLHIGDVTVALQNSCSTEHKLNVKIGDQVLCAPMTADTVAEKSLRVKLNDTVYTVCNGTCGGGGGGEYVMPETPPVPAQLPTSCTWTQSNSNAYLLSDGNQYFNLGNGWTTRNNIEVTLQIANGKSTRIFGTVNSSCRYDMTINNSGNLGVRFGSTGQTYTISSAQQTAKNTFKTENGEKTYKRYYINNQELTSGSGKMVSTCTTSNMYVLNNDYVTINQANSGNIKLYSIKVYNTSGTLIHNYQPVAAGTHLTNCGTNGGDYIVPTNCMWDTETKQILLPGGTGEMGYGVDP